MCVKQFWALRSGCARGKHLEARSGMLRCHFGEQKNAVRQLGPTDRLRAARAWRQVPPGHPLRQFGPGGGHPGGARGERAGAKC